MNKSPSIMLVAGEPSGDYLGGRLMSALQEDSPQGISFYGVGGGFMAAQGLNSLFSIQEISVNGLQEVITRIPHLLRHIKQVADFAIEKKPDLLVIIDSPDFTHRVARRVRRLAPEIPIVNYVPPTVWLWRKGRARRMRKYVDLILSLLPFEPRVFEQEKGPPCIYTGHPAVEVYMNGDQERGRGFRQKYNISDNETILLLAPGSRYNEIQRLNSVFERTLSLLSQRYPRLRPVVLATVSVEPQVRDLVSRWSVPHVLVIENSEQVDLFRASNVALAASGTISLELALANVPTVIAYTAGVLTGVIVHSLHGTGFLNLEYASLVNIALQRKIVPEHLAIRLNPKKISQSVLKLLTDDNKRNVVFQGFADFQKLMSVTGSSPTQKAAGEIMGLLREKSKRTDLSV
ncbi:MAG: lipid-A-disaccharide synthase [Parvularculales bacterium]